MVALFTCGGDAVMANMTAMAKSYIASLIALATPTVSVAAASEPLVLKPTSSWQVNYANERCRLGRQFGEGNQTMLLFMDRFSAYDEFRLTIAGKLVETRLQKGDADIQFGPTEQKQKLAYLIGNIAEDPAFVFTRSTRIAPFTAAEQLATKNRGDNNDVDIQPVSQERKKAVKYVRIGKPLNRPVTLETGSLGAPFAALDKCIDNLVASWGVDVEKHKTLSRAATPLKSPDTWIKSYDYPKGMLFAGQPALVNFRLSIGPDGVPTACHIQATTRPKEFDNAVCKSVMKRARFSPALDAQGQPLASYYQNNVYFRLP